MPKREELVATILGALIAFAAHGGKLAVRAVVTHSPEPFSNVALSLGEDTAVVFLTWFVKRHPYTPAVTVLAFLAVTAIAVRFVWRAVRRMFGGRGALRHLPVG